MSADDQREQRGMDLDALEELERAASPAPWEAEGHIILAEGRTIGSIVFRRDRDLIAALRNHAPDLIAAARERDSLAEEVMRHQTGQSYEVGHEHGTAAGVKYGAEERDRLRATIERVRVMAVEWQRLANIEADPDQAEAASVAAESLLRALDGAP